MVSFNLMTQLITLGTTLKISKVKRWELMASTSSDIVLKLYLIYLLLKSNSTEESPTTTTAKKTKKQAHTMFQPLLPISTTCSQKCSRSDVTNARSMLHDGILTVLARYQAIRQQFYPNNKNQPDYNPRDISI